MSITKKFVTYLILFIIICFAIPILFTKKFEEIEVSSNLENQNNNQENEGNKQENKQVEVSEIVSTYNYKEYATIKLLHVKTNQVEEIKLDDYLYGVVSSEMPANFEEEALKAQAVVARTYTIYKIQNNLGKHGEASICDDSTCCQAWISKEDRFARWQEETREANWNKITKSVNLTQGKIITYEGKPINAFFHSNSGGKTETTANVWGGTGYPYLQSIETAGEDAYTQYNSEAKFTRNDLINKIKGKHADFQINFDEPECIKILEYTEGNRVKTVKIGNLQLSGVEVRTILGLRSANFDITINGDEITFTVKGYGHGVGMSQTGADSMAKSGSNYEEIIKHFYSGVEIEYL